MQRGNCHCVIVGAIAIGLVVSLAGCSATGSASASNVAVVAIGQQAVGFASPGSDGSSTGWRSSQPCSTEFQDSARSGAPAGVTLAVRDPSSMSGPLDDPQLNSGDVATCAFTATSASRVENQEFFLGMPQSYLSKYGAKLVADGFTAGPTVSETTTSGTEQSFTKGTERVDLIYSTDSPGLLAIFG